LAACIFIALGAGWTPIFVDAQPLPRTVRLLDQGSANYPMAQAIVSAFQSEMNAQAGVSVPVIVESLNLAVFGRAHHIDLLRDYLREKYRDRPISVIVARGPILVPHAIRMRDELWPGTPLIFVDIAARSIAELNLPANVTGVTNNPRLQDMVDVARTLVPNLGRIAVVGDSSKDSPRATRDYTQDLPHVAAKIEVIDLTGLPLAEVKQRIGTLPADAAIIYWTLTVDGTGTAYVSRDVLKSLVAVANRPIVIDVETSVGTGAVGGPIQSAAAVGQVAARLAWRVLNGENPSSIPVRDYDDTKLVFDWRQLQRWGISEKRLPAGSEIRFRPPTAWEQYSTQISLIAVALLGQMLLITWLLHERRRRHRAEVETRQRATELVRMNRRAVAGQMSASIAHEVNQPLTAILSNAETLRDLLGQERLDLEEIREIVGDIIAEDTRASEVIDRIRRLLRKDEGKSETVDLNQLVKSTMHLLHGDLVKRKTTVETALAPDLPAISGDAVQLQQVLLNLLINAMDAVGSKSPPRRMIKISTRANGKQVEANIADFGIGIAADNQRRLFEPFFTTKEHGLGLGLSICSTIVKAHGGQLGITRPDGPWSIWARCLTNDNAREAGHASLKRSKSFGSGGR
jgi:signal transduction histidine kinase